MNKKYLHRINILNDLGVKLSKEDEEVLYYLKKYENILKSASKYDLENGNVVYLNHDENAFLLELLPKSRLEYCPKIFDEYSDLILSYLLDIQFCHVISIDNRQVYDYIIKYRPIRSKVF